MKLIYSRIQKFSLLIVIFILVNPTATAMNNIVDVNITAVGHITFISSHWEGQEMIAENETVHKFRDLKIIEEETFTANMTLKNIGQSIRNSNVTILFQYGDVHIKSRGEIGTFQPGGEVTISVSNLPSTDFIDWSLSYAILEWEANNIFNSRVEYEHIVKISPFIKPSNFDKRADKMEGESDKMQKPSSLPNNPASCLCESDKTSSIRTLSSGGYIQDVWEGNTYSSSTLSKGNSPSLKVKVYFNSNHYGFFTVTYTVKALDHGWTKSFTSVFFGSYSGSHTFTLQPGWSFANSQYAFGQGNYQFYSADIWSEHGWSDFRYGAGLNDNFNVVPSSSSNVVFLSVVRDSYIKNQYTLDLLNDVVPRFYNKFMINYYISLKMINWIHSSAVITKNLLGQDYQLSTLNNDEIGPAHRNAHKSALSLNNEWKIGNNAKIPNHGYDQALSITGLIRAESSDHGGKAGAAARPGNNAWGTPGLELSGGVLALLGSAFDNLIQHELSHNFGAKHDNTWYAPNVMWSTQCDCSNWRQKAVDEMLVTRFNTGPHT
jgi:hypothetical protein